MDKFLHRQVLMQESFRDQFWALFFSGLYQRSGWWPTIKCKILCSWHFCISIKLFVPNRPKKLLSVEKRRPVLITTVLRRILKKTSINNYMQSFCETTSRLWWHYEAYNRTFQQKLQSTRYNICLYNICAIDNYYRNTLPRIGFGIPLMSCLFYKIFQENKPLYLFNLIPTKIRIIIPELQIKLLYIIRNIIFLKIIFFHPLLLNGTSQILIFELLLVLEKNLQKEFVEVLILIATTPKESNTSQDLTLP